MKITSPSNLKNLVLGLAVCIAFLTGSIANAAPTPTNCPSVANYAGSWQLIAGDPVAAALSANITSIKTEWSIVNGQGTITCTYSYFPHPIDLKTSQVILQSLFPVNKPSSWPGTACYGAGTDGCQF